MKKNEPLFTGLMGMQIEAATVENSMEVSQKIKKERGRKKERRKERKKEGKKEKKNETLIQKDMCTPMFTSALFIKAKLWKQLKCPSIDE